VTPRVHALVLSRTHPVRAAAGVVVIRVWMEPASAGTCDDALRARVITARDPDLSIEETSTVAGADGVLTIVREFLAELAEGEKRR
jgi:hypothetical protein